jgi:hypothetical protein
VRNPYHGPWAHPHTERALPLIADPYANDHAQRIAATEVLPSFWFGEGDRPPAPTLVQLWETR